MAKKAADKIARFDQGNWKAAEIILTQPERYAPGSLMYEWAVLVVERAKLAGWVTAARV